MQITCPSCKFSFDFKEAKIRSLPENKYYWGVVIEILSQETGYTKEDMHEVLRRMFLKEISHIKGKSDKIIEVEFSRSTASLKVWEFEEYLENIRTWASSDLGVIIPSPNE